MDFAALVAMCDWLWPLRYCWYRWVWRVTMGRALLHVGSGERFHVKSREAETERRGRRGGWPTEGFWWL